MLYSLSGSTNEEVSICEDIKHGLIFGSHDFVNKIKNQFLSDKRNAELPQHNSIFADFEPEEILKKAAQILIFDLNCINKQTRLSPNEKEKRDCIIYLLCKTGRFSNQKIASLVGLTYSSISKQVSIFRKRLIIDKEFEKKI